MKKILYGFMNMVFGYFTIPFLFIGYLFGTNTSKGRGVYNPEGEMFIPVGITMLLMVVAVLINQIMLIIRKRKDKKEMVLVRYSANICYIVGIMLCVYWLYF